MRIANPAMVIKNRVTEINIATHCPTLSLSLSVCKVSLSSFIVIILIIFYIENSESIAPFPIRRVAESS